MDKTVHGFVTRAVFVSQYLQESSAMRLAMTIVWEWTAVEIDVCEWGEQLYMCV